MRSPIGALVKRKADVNTPVPFASRAQSYARGLFGSSRGMTAQLDSMGSVSTLFAIVNRTAKAEAGVEWALYRKAKSGKKEDRVEVTAHAALDLWNKPNDFFTQSVFVEAGAQHKQLTGETWWVVAKDPRVPDLPLEMWVVRPDRIRPVPDPEKFLVGYMYMGPDGQEVALRKEDVIFTRTPHPTDPYRGIGPVQALLTDLDAARYSAEWNRNFFLNSAEPGGIIEVPSVLSDPEFDQLRDRWNDQHKGVANAHRVAILEHGKWIDRKFTQRDMQFADLRNLSREIIREAFGFPKPMTGAVDDVNRANGDSGERMFARWLCVPDLEAMRDALNYQLLPMYGRQGEGLEFDFKNPVPDDIESETKQLTARSDAAAVLVRAGFQPKGTLTAVGLPDIPYVGVTAAPAAPALEPAALWRKAVAGLTGGNAMRRKIVAADDGEEDPVRRQFETALESLLAEWVRVEGGWIDALADAVETAVDDDDAGALGELGVDTAAGAAVLETALAGMARRAADRMVAEAAEQGVEVDAPDLEVSNRVSVAGIRAGYGSELAAVAVATAALLGSELARSAAVEALRLFTPGAVGRQVADGVRSFLRGLKGRFKRDQLGGALHRAQNAGRIAVLEEAPTARYFATEKNDSNRCPPCGEIDGTEFDDLDAVRAAYGTGGYLRCEGGIRCRGTVTAVWE